MKVVKNRIDENILNPVVQRPLSWETKNGKAMYLVPGYRANVMRMPHGKPMVVGIVSRTYKLVQMRDLCAALEDKLADHVDVGVMRVQDEFSSGGSVVERSYIIHRDDMPVHYGQFSKANTVGTTVAMLLKISTGYDGAHPTRVGFGSFDLWCSNGCYSYKRHVGANRKHTKNATVASFAHTFDDCIRAFSARLAAMRHRARVSMSMASVNKIFEEMNASPRLKEKLFNRVLVEIEERGAHLFAIESAFTYYASHDSEEFPIHGTGNNRADVLNRRQEMIDSWLRVPEMRRLEMAL